MRGCGAGWVITKSLHLHDVAVVRMVVVPIRWYGQSWFALLADRVVIAQISFSFARKFCYVSSLSLNWGIMRRAGSVPHWLHVKWKTYISVCRCYSLHSQTHTDRSYISLYKYFVSLSSCELVAGILSWPSSWQWLRNGQQQASHYSGGLFCSRINYFYLYITSSRFYLRIHVPLAHVQFSSLSILLSYASIHHCRSFVGARSLPSLNSERASLRDIHTYIYIYYIPDLHIASPRFSQALQCFRISIHFEPKIQYPTQLNYSWFTYQEK